MYCIQNHITSHSGAVNPRNAGSDSDVYPWEDICKIYQQLPVNFILKFSFWRNDFHTFFFTSCTPFFSSHWIEQIKGESMATIKRVVQKVKIWCAEITFLLLGPENYVSVWPLFLENAFVRSTIGYSSVLPNTVRNAYF